MVCNGEQLSYVFHLSPSLMILRIEDKSFSHLFHDVSKDRINFSLLFYHRCMAAFSISRALYRSIIWKFILDFSQVFLVDVENIVDGAALVRVSPSIISDLLHCISVPSSKLAVFRSVIARTWPIFEAGEELECSKWSSLAVLKKNIHWYTFISLSAAGPHFLKAFFSRVTFAVCG